jgi:hypothetical protein
MLRQSRRSRVHTSPLFSLETQQRSLVGPHLSLLDVPWNPPNCLKICSDTARPCRLFSPSPSTHQHILRYGQPEQAILYPIEESRHGRFSPRRSGLPCALVSVTTRLMQATAQIVPLFPTPTKNHTLLSTEFSGVYPISTSNRPQSLLCPNPV